MECLSALVSQKGPYRVQFTSCPASSLVQESPIHHPGQIDSSGLNAYKNSKSLRLITVVPNTYVLVGKCESKGVFEMPHLDSNVHSSIMHNSQKVGTTQMSTDLNPDPQKVVFVHTMEHHSD